MTRSTTRSTTRAEKKRTEQEAREKALCIVWERLGTQLPAVDRATREARLFGITSISCRLGDYRGRYEAAKGVLLAAAAGKLDRLRYLDINNSYIEDVGALARLTCLTRLDIGRARGFYQPKARRALASALASLIGLRSLDISYCPLLTRAGIHEGLTGLTSLNIRGNYLWDVEELTVLAALTGLRSLDIASCHLFGNAAETIARLTGLTSLDVSDNDEYDYDAFYGGGFGGEGFRALTALTGLRELRASCCDLGPSAAETIARLTGLTSLQVSGNPDLNRDGAFDRALCELTGLRDLSP